MLAGTLVLGMAGLTALAQNPVTQTSAPPLPGMPPVLDPNDIYAADHAGMLADHVKK